MSRTSLARTLAWALTLTTFTVAGAACSTGRPDPGPDAPFGDAAPFTNGVSTLSGAAAAAYFDGDRADARFNDPVNAAWGPDGKLYIADFNNSKIRVSDTGGNTTTLINQKNFIRPYGLLFLPDGTLFVETDNDATGANNLMSGTLWKIPPGATTAEEFAADIGRPRGLALLPSGLVAMSDEFHHVIRTIDPTSGKIDTLAGTWDQAGMVDATGAAARFSTPYGIAARPDGTLVVCDFDNSRLRVVTEAGEVSTLTGGAAGFADGAMADAHFKNPQAIASDASGNLYVTDMMNYRIREISGDTVSTIAGDGTAGFEDSDTATDAQLFGLEGITLKKDASVIYFTDGDRGTAAPYNRIRQVKL
jgi:DNA-binding beta-propeller fold protein YncE